MANDGEAAAWWTTVTRGTTRQIRRERGGAASSQMSDERWTMVWRGGDAAGQRGADGSGGAGELQITPVTNDGMPDHKRDPSSNVLHEHRQAAMAAPTHFRSRLPRRCSPNQIHGSVAGELQQQIDDSIVRTASRQQGGDDFHGNRSTMAAVAAR
ncbi:hypothetical protein ACLOJK_000108 [Asimina triloba]